MSTDWNRRTSLLIPLVLVFVAVPALARDLSFEDRVRAQEALERVAYSHQIGATEPFERAVPREVLERKVLFYLKESAALESVLGAPVTGEMLRSETERMASATRMPERLAEMYAALGDDPFLIQECIARPVLVDRLARSSFAGDGFETWWKTVEPSLDERSVRAVADSVELTRPVAIDRSEPPSGKAPEAACAGAMWGSTSMGHVPQGRSNASAVWTGSAMIVWGGKIAGNNLNSGARYDPATDSRRPISITGAPSPRYRHTAVWTGTRMVIWGGQLSGGPGMADGARYDPLMDTWSSTSLTNAPSGRYSHTAVWTGKQMIVWGGANAGGIQYAKDRKSVV